MVSLMDLVADEVSMRRRRRLGRKRGEGEDHGEGEAKSVAGRHDFLLRFKKWSRLVRATAPVRALSPIIAIPRGRAAAYIPHDRHGGTA